MFIALAIGGFVKAQQKVGEYTHGEKTYEISAVYGSDGLNAYVQVQGESAREMVLINITGEEKIHSFVNGLKNMKDKFIEWKKVAKENSVTDFKKEYNISFPSVMICWLGTKWYFSHPRDCFHPNFNANEYGIYSSAFGEAKSMNNEYITQKWFLILDTEGEIDGLIKALDVETIKKKLNKTANTDELFK